MAMRRRCDCYVFWKHNMEQFKEVVQVEVHPIYLYPTLQFYEERSFPSCSTEVVEDMAEYFGIIYTYSV